jgi:D-ribulokinase
MLEGIARIEQQGYQRLVELGAPYPCSIYTAGSGARNMHWQKIREQILNVPIHNAKQQDAAYGAALLAKGFFK